MKNYNTKLRLIILSFLQFAVWGAYLMSMGRYLGSVGLGDKIGWFYSVQGIVSIFMPATMGIIADRWVPAQKLLSFCHAVVAVLFAAVAYVGGVKGEMLSFDDIFWLYATGVAFYMPTLALSNSVSYTALRKAGLDTVKAFPPIRAFGTLGFIVSMWIVDLLGYQSSCNQFYVSAFLGVVLALYSLTMPACPVGGTKGGASFVSTQRLDAFRLFSQRRMALFFIFAMLMGGALQISNGYANSYIASFSGNPAYAGTFAVEHTNIIISLSQMSEMFCILLVPFFMGRLGIKRVMLIAMIAWVLRFALFALGNPGNGVWMFILSMIVYGVAFDFFNISGSLFVDKEVPGSMRSSAQGLFMLVTNGLGASIGVVAAQAIVNKFATSPEGWSTAWYIFAAYVFVVCVLFAIFFEESETKKTI